MIRSHANIHLNMGDGKFEVCVLGEDFPDTHTLATEACTIFCTAEQLRQLKAALDSYLAGLPDVVDSERKEAVQTAEDSQLEP